MILIIYWNGQYEHNSTVTVSCFFFGGYGISIPRPDISCTDKRLLESVNSLCTIMRRDSLQLS